MLQYVRTGNKTNCFIMERRNISGWENKKWFQYKEMMVELTNERTWTMYLKYCSETAICSVLLCCMMWLKSTGMVVELQFRIFSYSSTYIWGRASVCISSLACGCATVSAVNLPQLVRLITIPSQKGQLLRPLLYHDKATADKKDTSTNIRESNALTLWFHGIFPVSSFPQSFPNTILVLWWSQSPL